MKKKRKLLLPDIVIEILDHDAKHFDMTREKLCNEIIIKLGYKERLSLSSEIKFTSKKYIQFNLGMIAGKVYDDIFQRSEDISDPELMRSIFNAYFNYHPYVREYILFKEKITYLERLQKKGEEVIVSTNHTIIRGTISSINRCSETQFRKIVIGDTEEYISKIKIVS